MGVGACMHIVCVHVCVYVCVCVRVCVCVYLCVCAAYHMVMVYDMVGLPPHLEACNLRTCGISRFHANCDTKRSTDWNYTERSEIPISCFRYYSPRSTPVEIWNPSVKVPTFDIFTRSRMLSTSAHSKLLILYVLLGLF